MVLPFTFIFGVLGYIFYKSKEEVSLIDDFSKEVPNDEDDLYNDLEDLFI